MSGNRRWAPLALAFALALGGCGDDEGAESVADSAAMTTAFQERAQEAYEAEGLDREEDFTRGVFQLECFILDPEGAEAIAAAISSETEAELSDANFLQGAPGEEERLSCGLGGRQAVSVVAGTTLATAEQTRERLLRDLEASEVEGESASLDPESVVAVEALGIRRFLWVDGDFVVGLAAPAEELDADAGFEALAVAIDEVERTLTG